MSSITNKSRKDKPSTKQATAAFYNNRAADFNQERHNATIRQLKALKSELVKTCIVNLERKYDWLAKFGADDHLVIAQCLEIGITEFIDWLQHPGTLNDRLLNMFKSHHPTIINSFSIEECLQMIRTSIKSAEQRAHVLAPDDSAWLLHHLMVFSRELSYKTATLYQQADQMGLRWDYIKEARVARQLFHHEITEKLVLELQSLNWSRSTACRVVTGNAAFIHRNEASNAVRAVAAKHKLFALTMLDNNKLDVIVYGDEVHVDFYEDLKRIFLGQQIIVSDDVKNYLNVDDAHRACVATRQVLDGSGEQEEILYTNSYLTQRLFIGDTSAQDNLINRVYKPLYRSSYNLFETMFEFVREGGSLENTSKVLEVHTNTVRYRLRKVAEILPYDPFDPKDCFVIHCALVTGHLRRQQDLM